MKDVIAPSILAANLLAIEQEIKEAEGCGADEHHIDVMDGHFVPNLSFGLPVIRAIKKVSTIPLDVHLMIEKPDRSFEHYIQAGADSLSFHIEATEDPLTLVKMIQSRGVLAGLAISPQTPINAAKELLPHVDYVLLMTVVPGFSGQSFLPESFARLGQLGRLINESGEGVKPRIQVDGGINRDNLKKLKQLGASSFVVGSAFFGCKYRKAEMDIFRQILGNN